MGFFSRLFGTKAPAPRVIAHVAFGGAIRVIESPTSDAWEVAENERSGEDFTVRVVKYVLPMEPAPLALLAKIYTGSAVAEPPERTDWRAVFGSLFSEISSVETKAATQLTMKGSLGGVEALLSGTSADGVPIRLRERRSVQGREQFIVTAMGPADAFAAHPDEIERWFSTSAFVPAEPRA